MPATRSQSTASRVVPRNTPSPHRPQLRSSDSLTFSSSDIEESTMPVNSKRKDKTQQQPLTPAIIPGEIIEISDDDDDPPHQMNSQVSMVADFRRQINKLREVRSGGISVYFNAIFFRPLGECQAQKRS